MIDQLKAREVAEQFIAGHDLRGFRYQFATVTSTARRSNEWGVVFDVYSQQDSLIEGPVVILVDKVTGAVRFL